MATHHCWLLVLVFPGGLLAATHGRVLDLNGAPVPQAMVILTKAADAAGPAATTVFTDAEGSFAFGDDAPPGTLRVRHLGHEPVTGDSSSADSPVTLLVRPEANQAAVAPASAYLQDMNPASRERLVMACVSCHQMPAPEVRDYARLLDDTPQTQTPDARKTAWAAIVKQMNYVSSVEFGRAGHVVPTGDNVYSGGDPAPTAKLLVEGLKGPLQEVRHYGYGAPLIVTPRTRIREYVVPAPNAIREAVPFEGTAFLWAADVSSNRLMRINTATGAVDAFAIPGADLWGPHTLVPGRDGVWASPFFPGAVTRFDPHTEQWKVWRLASAGAGPPVGIHDMSFDADHMLATDKQGRIWFSDIVNNAVGWFDPRSGKIGQFKIPAVPGREGDEQVYGLSMSPDRRHVWYCQLGIASFGSFNIDTLKFETHVEFDSPNAGPRRMSMSDDGVLYLALYGAGQLAAYDTKAGRMLGIFDLPDRASAPYATTWDPVRKVVWIPTSNGDVIYRFDPRTRGFGVLPLPRERGFLRMLHVDARSGALVTSYANIVEHVRGPRMALLIDPGDAPAGSAWRKTATSYPTPGMHE